MTDKDEYINFANTTSGILSIFTENLRFDVRCAGTVESFSILGPQLKGVSTLKASLVDDFLTITNLEDEEISFTSNIEFTLISNRVLVDPPEFTVSESYIPSDDLKILSKILGKFSKDNFKGTLLLTDRGFIIPGEYHITQLPLKGLKVEEEKPYSIKSVELNKLLKLGQDIAISGDGRLYSKGEIQYQVQLPPGNNKASIGSKVTEILDLYSEDVPILEIQEPKLFKDFIKNTKSLDRQYDLCKIQTEETRISLSFYKDKKPLSKFIYNNVVTPQNYIEFFLQVKHITALSELATESVKIHFSSNNDPLKVMIDDKYESYIMQGIVV